jgi:nucleotide-binding universal stress UspA family protein
MKTILIPFAAGVIRHKIKKYLSTFAKPTQYKIHLLHVQNMPSAVGLVDDLNSITENIQDELMKKEENAASQLANELSAEGFQVDISFPLGFFDQEFVSFANEMKPNFILMFTSGAHSAIEDLFGTNTSHVFEKIKSPVFVVPSEIEFKKLSNAAVALHLENEDFSVMKEVLEFADENHIKLHFFKIDNTYQLDIISDEATTEKLQKLFPGKIDEIEHRKAEDAVKGIINYATEKDADLVVLFTTKRSFIEKLFHKSVTKDLVLHATKPLLIFHY